MEELIAELKLKIIQSLGLSDLDPDQITAETSFWAGGLELDSVDILDLVVLLDREYGVQITSREQGQKIFVDLGTLAGWVAEHRRPGQLPEP